MHLKLTARLRTLSRWAAAAAYASMIAEQSAFGVSDPHLQLPVELVEPLSREASFAPVSPVTASIAPVGPRGVPAPEVTLLEVVAGDAGDGTGAEAGGPTVTLVAKVKAPAGSKELKWESEAKAQVIAAVRRFGKPLQNLLSRDANEGDTRTVRYGGPII